LISKQVILFLASTNVDEVEISHEHIGYQWMEINEAVNQLTYSNAKTALASAIDFLKDLTPNTK
jgi:hypothetical protein